MNSESDINAIDELRAMARVYSNHGFREKAEQMLQLADAMEARMRRSADLARRVVNMSDYRDEVEDEEERAN